MNTLELEGEYLARYLEVRAEKEAKGVNYRALAKVLSGQVRLPVHCFEPGVSRRMSTARRASQQWNGAAYYGRDDE